VSSHVPCLRFRSVSRATHRPHHIKTCGGKSEIGAGSMPKRLAERRRQVLASDGALLSATNRLTPKTKI
jgi:hypothetical protein